MQAIDSFRGDNEFLSSGFSCNIEFEGAIYPSLEHAFQAAKTDDLTARANIQAAATATDAKNLGKQVVIVPDWDQKRLDVMASLVRQKFTNNLDLKVKLLMTGTKDLVQGGMRRDRFWGTDKNGVGENHLGKILVTVRDAIRASEGGVFTVVSDHLTKHGLGFVAEKIAALKTKSNDLTKFVWTNNCPFDVVASAVEAERVRDEVKDTLSDLE